MAVIYVCFPDQKIFFLWMLKALNSFVASVNSNGTKLVTVDLSLRRKFQWLFVIADVSRPIIGADILQNFGLLIDLKNCRLIDSKTSLVAAFSEVKNKSTVISLIVGKLLKIY